MTRKANKSSLPARRAAPRPLPSSKRDPRDGERDAGPRVGLIGTTGPDLLIRGGTVVTAGGSRRADVAVRGGDRGGRGRPVGACRDGGRGRRRDRAAGAARLRRRPHPYPGRVATTSRTASSRIRSRRRSAARRRSSRSTTRAPARRPPRSGRSLTGIDELRRRHRRRQRRRLRAEPRRSAGGMDDPLAELPAMVDAGVADREGVHGLRLPARRPRGSSRRCGSLGERGGMLEVHCEDPVLIDAAVAAALAAWRHRTTLPRCHAIRRGRGRRDRTGRMAFARAADAPVHVVHLSCAAALRHVAEARRAGVRATAETCPHYLALDRRALRRARPGRVREERDLAAAPVRPPTRTRCGPGSPPAILDSSPRTTSPTGVASRRATPLAASRSTRISNGAPGIETLLAIVYGRGRRHGPDRASSGWSTCSRRRRRGGSGCRARARSRPAATPTSSCSTRPPGGRSAQADLHHTSDFTPYEGIEVAGAVRSRLRPRPGGRPRRPRRRRSRLGNLRRTGKDRTNEERADRPSRNVTVNWTGRRTGSRPSTGASPPSAAASAASVGNWMPYVATTVPISGIGVGVPRTAKRDADDGTARRDERPRERHDGWRAERVDRAEDHEVRGTRSRPQRRDLRVRDCGVDEVPLDARPAMGERCRHATGREPRRRVGRRDVSRAWLDHEDSPGGGHPTVGRARCDRGRA